MKINVIAIASASVMQLVELSIQLLLKKNRSFYSIISLATYELVKSDQVISIQIESDSLNNLWINKLEVIFRQLACHCFNDNSVSIESVIYKTMCIILVACSMGILRRLAYGFLFDVLSDLKLKVNNLLNVLPREFKLNLTHRDNFKLVSISGGLRDHPFQVVYNNTQIYNDLSVFILFRWFDSLYENLNYLKRLDGPNK